MIVTTLIVLACLCAVYLFMCRRLLPPDNKLIPTYPGKWPIIGHSYYLMKIDDVLERFISFGEYSLKTGDVTKVYMGPMPFHIITDPTDASTVLNKCLEKMFVYKFVEPIVGKMLVSAEVSLWKRNRRILDLCFKQHLLNEYLQLFNEQADRFAESLTEYVGKDDVDLRHKITKSVLETSCRTTLGARHDGKDVVNDNYIQAVNDSFDILMTRVQKPWLMSDFIFNLSRHRQRLNKALDGIFAISKEMVLLRKSEHLQRLKNKDKFVHEGGKYQSVLDILVENTVTEDSSLFTDDDMRRIADNMLIATFDTTVNQLLFVLVCVASFKEMQEKIYEEITSVLGEDGKMSKENMSQLIYLEAAIKECIRLYPVAPVVGRQTTTDTKLKNVTIPAGSNIGVHLWSINRNPRYWGSDADEFKPERWLSPDTVPHHPAAYASFSPGRRGCIGKTYAIMYMKSILVSIIRKFNLTADHTKMKFDYKVLLVPASGYLMKIEERKSNKPK